MLNGEKVHTHTQTYMIIYTYTYITIYVVYGKGIYMQNYTHISIQYYYSHIRTTYDKCLQVTRINKRWGRGVNKIDKQGIRWIWLEHQHQCLIPVLP